MVWLCCIGIRVGVGAGVGGDEMHVDVAGENELGVDVNVGVCVSADADINVDTDVYGDVNGAVAVDVGVARRCFVFGIVAVVDAVGVVVFAPLLLLCGLLCAVFVA